MLELRTFLRITAVIYVWGVESIEICDYLGLFGKKKQFAGVTKVSVMPEETTDRYMEADRANAYYDEENEVYVKSASDEVSELREYRDGDSQGIFIGREAVYLQRMTLLLKSTARTLIRRYSSLLTRTGEEKSHGVFQRMSRIYAEMMSQGAGMCRGWTDWTVYSVGYG